MNQNPTAAKVPVKQWIITVFLIVLTIFFLSCSKEESPADAGAPSSSLSGDGGSDASVQAVSVRVAESTSGEMETLISLSAEVSATGEAGILPDTGGLLTRVLVKSGDMVNSGQIVAWVDPSRPGMSYAASPVRSDVSGTVTSVPAVAGNQVTVQSVIARVANLNRLEVGVRVPEKYLASLHKGMEGRIVSRSFPDLEQSAKVTEIAPVVDPLSRTVNVTLEPLAGHRLLPGQAVSVNLVLESRSNLVLVPESALTERRDGYGVFTYEGNRAVWRPVSPGTGKDGLVEIVSGLETGEPVVVAGMDRISDGSTLRIVGDEVL